MTDRKVPSLISAANIRSSIEMYENIINDPTSAPDEVEAAKVFLSHLTDAAINYKLDPDQKPS